MQEHENNLRKELGEKLQTGVTLRDYVSMAVGGVADYFYSADSIDELIKSVSAAVKLEIPFFVIGGGYNIIPSDSGFPGLVIKNSSSNIAFSGENSQVVVDSGVNIGTLITNAASKNLGGLEFLYGIPGTVGGAIYGNAGAFGFEIGEFVKNLIILVPDKNNIKIVKREHDWINFSYRSSKLKNDYEANEQKPVILTARIQLIQRRHDEIAKIMQDNLSKKRKTQPLKEKSAGSYFKNPQAASAGLLLDQAGAKKLKVGGAAVSKKHANFIINKKNATAVQIRELAEKAKEIVNEKFNISLDEEIEYIGRW